MCEQLKLFQSCSDREDLKNITDDLAYTIADISNSAATINEPAVGVGLKLFSEISNALEEYEMKAFNPVGKEI